MQRYRQIVLSIVGEHPSRPIVEWMVTDGKMVTKHGAVYDGGRMDEACKLAIDEAQAAFAQAASRISQDGP